MAKKVYKKKVYKKKVKNSISRSLAVYTPMIRKFHEIVCPNQSGTAMIATNGGLIYNSTTASTTRIANTVAGITDSYFSFTFCINQLNQYVAGYFSNACSYRIDLVKVKLYPSIFYGGAGPQGSAGLANNPPMRFYSLVDHSDNVTSLLTVASMRLNPNTKEHYFNGDRSKPYIISFKPAASLAAYNATTGFSTQVGYLPTNMWIDLLSSNTAHYGLKLAIPQPTFATSQAVTFDVEVDFYYSIKYN